MSCETITTTFDRSRRPRIRALALAMNAASPALSDSSSRRMSGSISVAMANARREYIPLE